MHRSSGHLAPAPFAIGSCRASRLGWGAAEWVLLLIGVGIGVGFGLLIAPTRGKEMRADIADRVSDFGEKVREHIGKKPQGATGTYGE
ncbi:MAG: YtxH domain-containing protein [Terriglobales bacterium]